MATIGVDNTTNTGGTDALGAIYPTIMPLPSGVPNAATLDSIDIYCLTVGALNIRIAVYEGGTSDTNMSGASLKWESGKLSRNIASAQWENFTANSASLSASTRLWVCTRSDTDFTMHWAPADGSEDGDFTTGNVRYYYSATSGGDIDTAFPGPTTSETSGSVRQGDPYKIRLNYTETGGSVAPLAGRHLQNLMSN